MESAEISVSAANVSLFKMKFLSLSSICMVAFGNLSLYRVFIIMISLSTTGDRIGLLYKDRTEKSAPDSWGFHFALVFYMFIPQRSGPGPDRG